MPVLLFEEDLAYSTLCSEFRSDMDERIIALVTIKKWVLNEADEHTPSDGQQHQRYTDLLV